MTDANTCRQEETAQDKKNQQSCLRNSVNVSPLPSVKVTTTTRTFLEEFFRQRKHPEKHSVCPQVFAAIILFCSWNDF